MTEQEFKNLEIGNTLSYQYREATINYIEYDYDYSTSPPTRHPWKVHLDNGTNLQINDDIRFVEIRSQF